MATDVPHRRATRSWPKTLGNRLYESLSALLGINGRAHRGDPAIRVRQFVALDRATQVERPGAQFRRPGARFPEARRLMPAWRVFMDQLLPRRGFERTMK